MSRPYATSVPPPPSSFTVLMVTTRTTLSTLTSNYTGVNISAICDVIGDVVTRAANDEEEEYIPYSDRPETYVVPIVLLLIMVIGLTGNGVLALTILRHTNMRNVPNTYVLSLALGDLLARIYDVCVDSFAENPRAMLCTYASSYSPAIEPTRQYLR